MADGGYTPSEIDRFTLADANLIFKRWADYPLVRVMVAGYLGVKPPAGSNGSAEKVERLTAQAMLMMFPGGALRA